MDNADRTQHGRAGVPGPTGCDALPVGDFGFWILDFGYSTLANPKSKIQNPKYLVFSLWLVPILAFWLVTLKLPLFQPRYLIISLPAYLVMAAAGLLALRRVHLMPMVAGAILLGLPTVWALLGVNYSAQA